MLIATRVSDGVRSRFESDNTDLGWTFTLPAVAGVEALHPARPSTAMLTDNLQDSALFWGQRASQCWIQAASDISTEARTIGMVACMGTNRRIPTRRTLQGWTYPAANTFRVLIDSYPLADRRRPAINAVTLTNLTGTSAMLSGPVDSPGQSNPSNYAATKLTATSHASNTVVVIEYANHHATERQLSGTQTFCVFVADSDDPETWPAIAVVLRQAGSDVQTLTATEVEKVTYWDPAGAGGISTTLGYRFTYTFNASLLTSTTGTISFRVTGTTTGASVPEPIGAEFVTELAGVLYDSGPVAADEGSYVAPGVEIPANAQRYVFWEFGDLMMETDDVVSGHDVVVRMPLAYGPLSVGRFLIADVIDRAIEAPNGFDRKLAGDQPILTKGGGPRIPQQALLWWIITVSLRYQSWEEFLTTWKAFVEAVGFAVPFAVVPAIDAREIFWCRLTGADFPHAGSAGGSESYDVKLTLETAAIVGPRG